MSAAAAVSGSIASASAKVVGSRNESNDVFGDVEVVDIVGATLGAAASRLSPWPQAPLLLRGALRRASWPAFGWARDLHTLHVEHGHRLVDVRFHRRPKEGESSLTQWEGEGVYLKSVRFGDFCAWLAASAARDGGIADTSTVVLPSLPREHVLAKFPSTEWWGYCSYQHFEDLFHDLPGANRDAANFVALLRDQGDNRVVGDSGCDREADVASESKVPEPTSAPTLWLGSAGARTPCHQDAYGVNLVAQVAGEKRWILYPPEAASQLGPRRLPYEDASTFTSRDPLSLPIRQRGVNGEDDGDSCREGVGGLHVVLQPFDVLYVPWHWFHAVEVTSKWSLSINQWFDRPEDALERVHEATVRCLASPLLATPLPCNWWVNPGEELYDVSDNTANLAEALENAPFAGRLQGSCGRSMMEPAFAAGSALLEEEQIAEPGQGLLSPTAVRAALLKAVTHPDVVASIVTRLQAELEQQNDPARLLVARVPPAPLLQTKAVASSRGNGSVASRSRTPPRRDDDGPPKIVKLVAEMCSS